MHTSKIRRILLNGLMFPCLLGVSLAIAGCIHCRDAGWREYKVFCGMSFQGGEVTEEEWQRFCNEQVTRRFPDGYTAFEATGYWKGGAANTIRESSRVLLIVAPADAKDKVFAIAREYRKQFHQEAVLVMTSGGDVVFVGSDDD